MATGVFLSMNFEARLGGVKALTLKVAEHLTALGEQVVLVAPASPEAASGHAARGFPAVRFRLPAGTVLPRPLRRLVRLLAVALAVVRAARRSRADYLAWMQWRPGPGIALVACAWALRVPCFVFAHGGEFTATGPWRWARRTVMRRAAAVICVSELMRAEALRFGVRPERAVTVMPGFDVADADAFRSRDRRGRFPDVEAAFPPGVPTVLSVCRLVDWKGVDRMIAALPEVVAGAPGARYVIVGAGPDEARLRRLASASPAADSIVFLGPMTGDAKLACYARCTAFALPSSGEPFGLVFLEAAAFGKAVVGGRTEPPTGAVLHGRTGLLVDPADQQALTDAVLNLLNDPARALRLGRAGRARTARELTWRRSARALRDLIHGRLAQAGAMRGESFPIRK